MARKTLNTKNLEQLGSERLAQLVMELVKGDASRQRHARMALSAQQGPKDVAADIRKRYSALRRATSYVSWRKQKSLVSELTNLLNLIETSIAPDDPDDAFDLYWSFLLLAPFIYERTDDSSGTIGGVMVEAIERLEALAPRLSLEPKALAERMLDGITGAGYGEFDGIIPALAKPLGEAGLAHLKALTEAWAAESPAPHEIDAFSGFGLSDPAERLRRAKALTSSVILADFADAQGDVDAYIARYTPEQLTYGTIAPGVAQRLLDTGRSDEALKIIAGARTAEGNTGPSADALDDVYEAYLAQTDQSDLLKDHLWARFEHRLHEASLRTYLKLLPDFEDMEAEERALNFAASHEHTDAALAFFLAWPAIDRAARLVLTRADDLDANYWELLTAAADTLSDPHPLAATVLRRLMVTDTLDGAKSKRYRHAARHLEECAAAARYITSFGPFPSHETFLETLRQTHGRKPACWDRFTGNNAWR